MDLSVVPGGKNSLQPAKNGAHRLVRARWGKTVFPILEGNHSVYTGFDENPDYRR
jgi:hypothetical protein